MKKDLAKKDEGIIWEQAVALLDDIYDTQTLGFFGFVDGKKKYFWETWWTFEAMDECIDICIEDICSFVEENF